VQLRSTEDPVWRLTVEIKKPDPVFSGVRLIDFLAAIIFSYPVLSPSHCSSSGDYILP
jgi:hypothetical protein